MRLTTILRTRHDFYSVCCGLTWAMALWFCSTAHGDLVAHWALDDGAGSATAADSVGGHTATLTNLDPNTAWITDNLAPVPSGTSAALTFNAANDEYLLATDYKGIGGTDARSITAWINTTDMDAAFVNWGNNAAGEKWTFRVQEGNGLAGALRLEVNGGYIVGNTFIADGQWHHVAIAWEADADPDVLDGKLYVDGQLQGFSATADEPINTGAGQDVRIGTDFNGSRQMNGGMDDVRIYDHALTAAEVLALSAGPPPPPPLGSDLLVHYTFESTSGGGSTVPDMSIHGFDGELAGDAKLTGPGGGVVGSAMELDGDNDFLNAGDINRLDGPGQLTVSLWFNRRTFTTDDANGPSTNHMVNNVLVAQSSDAQNDNLEIGTSDTSVELYLDTEGQDGPNGFAIDDGIANDTWHHLVLTYDVDAAEETKMYVDGELIMSSADWGGYIDASQDSPLTFGAARPDRADPWGEFDGFIDEVQIYSRAISAAEVQTLFNNPGATVIIPEPSGLMLALLFVMGLLASVRKRLR